MMTITKIQCICSAVFFGVQSTSAAPLSSILLSPIQQTLAPNVTPLLNIFWHPLTILRGAESTDADATPGSTSTTHPRTIAGMATSLLRDSTAETLEGLVSLKRTVEATGRDTLMHEAAQFTEGANRAAHASAVLGNRVRLAASTAVKGIEDVSNTMELRLQNAAVEALTKLKTDTGALVGVGNTPDSSPQGPAAAAALLRQLPAALRATGRSDSSAAAALRSLRQRQNHNDVSARESLTRRQERRSPRRAQKRGPLPVQNLDPPSFPNDLTM